MSLKTLVICVQALLIQSITGQCIGARPLLGAPCAVAPVLATPCAGALGVGPAAVSASHGPGVAVSTVSPLIPAGVSVLSENVYDGVLAAGGALPFLGTVAIEGVLPTAGAGAVAYGCGNGAVGITAEEIGAIGLPGLASPLGLAGPLGITGPLGIVGPASLAGPLGIGGPLDVVGPLGIAGSLGIGGPLGLPGPLGITRPLGITGAGCGCDLI